MDEAGHDVFDAFLSRILDGERPDPASFARERGVTDETVIASLRSLLEAAPANAEESAAPDLPRARIGEYRLLRKIGAGGMGVVYLAVQSSLRRNVAIKVLPPEHSDSVVRAARLKREAEILAKLEHPSIVRVLSAGDEDGACYLAMEYVAGEGLDEVLQRGTPDLRDVLRWCAEIAEALAVAHAAGVLHRDVKPSNIRIDTTGRARLLDFGLARDESAMTLTTTASFQGSLLYAAPEQLSSNRAQFGPATDVYALGVVLYEAIAGVPPFLADTPQQLIAAVLSCDPVALRRLAPTIPRDVETVVMKALERRPERRYGRAEDLAADLRALLDLRPIMARPPGVWEKARRLLRTDPKARFVALTAIVLVSIAIALYVRDEIAARDFARSIAIDLDRVDRARTRGDYDEALGVLGQIEARAPSDPRWRSLRDRIERENVSFQASELVSIAKKRIEEHRTLRNAVTVASSALSALEVRSREAVLSPEEELELVNGLARRETAAGDLAALRVSIVDDLSRAETLAPEQTAARFALVDFWVGEWRETIARGDTRGARDLAERIERRDTEGRYVAELAGLASLSITTDPAGASIFLFRYELDSERRKDGEPRLVPAPLDGAVPFVLPHQFVLRVVEAAGELKEGDLVVAIDGEPLRDAVYVGADVGEFKRGDRLLEVDGNPIRGAYGRDRLLDHARPCEVMLERVGERITTRFERGAPEPPLLDACEFAAVGDGIATVITTDGPREIELPRGLETRRTVNPLPLIAERSVGETPLASTPLASGSYLAVLRKEGWEDQRMPFQLGRGEVVELTAALDPVGATPRDFVRIRGGKTLLGGDPSAATPRDLETERLEPYFLMEREVTIEEYVEFLNDPEVLATIARAPGPIYFPRDEVNAHTGGYLQRSGGRFVIPRRLAGLPVCAISRDDATAYARWFDARAMARGETLEYGLPSDPQWEAAGRGADARLYPFGNVFVPFWVKSRFTHSPAFLEPPMRFPHDESPYGVFDLCGSVMEFVSTGGDGPNQARTKSGAFVIPDPPIFRLDGYHSLDPRSCEAMNGFRLAAWLRDAGG